MSSGISRFALAAAVTAAFWTPTVWAGAAAGPDWSKVEAKKIMLLYPAQTPWERLTTRERHSGARRWPGKTCVACHGGVDEHALGDSLANAEKFKEPTPIMGKPGAVDTMVKMAHDAQNFYVQVTFNPGMQPDAAMDKDFENKLTIMIDDGNVADANTAGCWVACHQDAESMNMEVKDRTKYVTATRQEGGEMKSEDEIKKMMADGKFFEYWQARFTPGGKPVAVDGTILDKRADNKSPAVKVDATRGGDGMWTVTFTRKLTGVKGHKDLVPGKTYNLGFAIHAGHTAKRFHYVSFERTMVLDSGMADFVVTK